MSISHAPARWRRCAGALDTLFFGGNRMLRVFGKVGDSAKEFELVLPDKRLRAAMLAYSRNVALLSLLDLADHRDAGFLRPSTAS